MVYGSTFWLVYLANTALTVAMSILFRYADFITSLGGTELQLGLIVGTGMIGSLSMRALQGIGIDRFGPRRIWLLSLAMLSASLVGHVWVTNVDGPAVYILRTLLATSLAGAFGSSITFVSLSAPPRRMAEMIGILGTSGFVGMSIGPVVGDMLFQASATAPSQVDRMFIVAAAMSTISLLLAAVATRGHRVSPNGRMPPLLPILRRYHPGATLLVGMAMGWAIGLPQTFLRTYTAELHIGQMKLFFLVYSAVAMTVRIVTRRMTDRWGARPMILFGLGSLATTMLVFLVVRSQWMLVLPAATGGVAHALLFPAVVADVSRSFPRRYRGVATSLIMAMFDLGNLVGQPAVGAMIDGAKKVGLPPYAIMFVSVAAGLIGVAVVYARSRGPASVSFDRRLARTATIASRKDKTPDWPRDGRSRPPAVEPIRADK